VVAPAIISAAVIPFGLVVVLIVPVLVPAACAAPAVRATTTRAPPKINAILFRVDPDGAFWFGIRVVLDSTVVSFARAN